MQGEHDESRRFTQILGRPIHIDWIVPRQLGVMFSPCYQAPLLYTTSDFGWELVSFGWWRQVFPASLVLKTQSNTLLFLWLQRLTRVNSGAGSVAEPTLFWNVSPESIQSQSISADDRPIAVKTSCRRQLSIFLRPNLVNRSFHFVSAASAIN